MRLALLLAGVGALSLIGAVLGRGLGAPGTGGTEAQPIGTPTALALTPVPAAAAGGTPAPPVSTATPPEPVRPQPASPAPSVATAAGTPIHRVPAGAAAPQHLPGTGGDDAAPAAAPALALFVIGMVLCLVPGAGRQDEKE